MIDQENMLLEVPSTPIVDTPTTTTSIASNAINKTPITVSPFSNLYDYEKNNNLELNLLLEHTIFYWKSLEALIP